MDELLRMKDDVEQQQADGCEDDVVAEEQLDPQRGVAVSCEDVGGGPHHGQQGGNEDRKENQGQEEFAVAAANSQCCKENSVGNQRPGAQGQNNGEQPGVALDMKVVEDQEERSQN